MTFRSNAVRFMNEDTQPALERRPRTLPSTAADEADSYYVQRVAETYSNKLPLSLRRACCKRSRAGGTGPVPPVRDPGAEVKCGQRLAPYRTGRRWPCSGRPERAPKGDPASGARAALGRRGVGRPVRRRYGAACLRDVRLRPGAPGIRSGNLLDTLLEARPDYRQRRPG